VLPDCEFLPLGIELSSLLSFFFLRSLRWFLENISEQRTGLIFRDKNILDILNLEDGTDTLSQIVGTKRKVRPSYNPKERKSPPLFCEITTLINWN